MVSVSPVTPDEHGFPSGFFRRTDESADDAFYEPDRLVTHIGDRPIVDVGHQPVGFVERVVGRLVRAPEELSLIHI